MKINANNNDCAYNKYSFNFAARNAEIRFADDIARKINKEFPRLSPSKVEDFNNIRSNYAFFLEMLDKLRVKLFEMRSKKYQSINNAESLSQVLSAITTSVKDYKIGNCGESAQLAEIAARANGINDCSCAFAFGNGWLGAFEFDHTVLMVKNNNKPYIIDAWLGFADYLPEAIKRYQKDFREHFDFCYCIDEKIYFDKHLKFNPTGDIFAKGYSEEELKKLYPELVIKKH